MSVLNKEQFFERIKSKIGEDNSDDALSFIEDMTDTFNDMEVRTTSNNDAEWEAKYKELDNTWREKFKKRFFDASTSSEEIKSTQTEDVKDDGKATTFEDLFTEREG